MAGLTEKEARAKKRWDSVYALMSIALDEDNGDLPAAERQKVVIAKSYLGNWLDRRFPIMNRALLLDMMRH